jgi:hypothetical protein
MSDEKMLPFEQQFDEVPTRISSFTLLTGELVAVYIHQGRVDVPIYPPEEIATEMTENGEEAAPFLLTLNPLEARNLAGLLTYASGRADEHAPHCVDCGDTIDHEHQEDDDE